MLTQLEPLYDKKCKCPICENSFTSKKIRSRFIKLVHTDTDFCPSYSPPENNPIYYQIFVCPKCGYSYQEDFSEYFPPKTKEDIIKKVCANWNPQDFSGKRTIEDAIITYKLAVYCATLKKEKHVIIAGMYMKLAWLNRLLENKDQEQRFLKLAIQEYTETYSVQDYLGTPVSEVRVLYLLGELSWRTGNIKEAGLNFSRVIEQQKNTTEIKIVEMAKERWQEIRQSKE